jgi:Cu-Zn family superoxide dismutase
MRIWAFAILMAGGCVGPALDGGDPTSGASDDLTTVTRGTGPWTVFDDPFGDTTPNPDAMIQPGNIIVNRFMRAKTMSVTMTLKGIGAGLLGAAHGHLNACADNKGGGHYQDQVGGPHDANNELWFSWEADANGAATAKAYVKWLPRPGELKSIVIHDVDDDGMGNPVAGAKLVCMDLALN